MEPLTPEQIEEALRNHPQAGPEDVAEYERLLATRFSVDPSLRRSPEETRAAEAQEQRLRELYVRLFG